MTNTRPELEETFTPVPPRIRRFKEQRVFSFVISGITILACAVTLFRFNPSRYGFYPGCFFHQTTGLLCPGCGSLRALHHLLHGDLIAALHLNLLLVLSLPVLAVKFGKYFFKERNAFQVSVAVKPIWLWCACGLLLVFGVLRNFPFAHAFWLAP